MDDDDTLPIWWALDGDSLEDHEELEENNRKQPCHGFNDVCTLVAWWSDGEDSRYETN